VHDKAGEGEQDDPEERRALHLELADHQSHERDLRRYEQEGPEPDPARASSFQIRTALEVQYVFL